MSTIEIISLEDAKTAIREEMESIFSRLSVEIQKGNQDSAKYLSSSEVLKVLGISRATLARWRAQNRIAFSKIDGKILYESSKIEELVQRHSISHGYSRRES